MVQLESYHKVIADQKDANSKLEAKVQELEQRISIVNDHRESTPNDHYG
jgi:phage shock protein A